MQTSVRNQESYVTPKVCSGKLRSLVYKEWEKVALAPCDRPLHQKPLNCARSLRRPISRLFGAAVRHLRLPSAAPAPAPPPPAAAALPGSCGSPAASPALRRQEVAGRCLRQQMRGQACDVRMSIQSSLNGGRALPGAHAPMKRLVNVSSSSAPPCSQSTLARVVP